MGKRRNFKRFRDRLCTQEFFALPPPSSSSSDDDDDNDDDNPSVPLPAQALDHSNCSDAQCTAASGPVANNSDLASSRPGRAAAQAKRGEWAKAEGVHRTAAAEYQEDFKRAYNERLERERERDELEDLNEPDWQDEAEELMRVSEKVLDEEGEHPVVVMVEAKCNFTISRLVFMKEELDWMLCHVQIFNGEKRFSFAEEQYLVIKRQQAARHGKVFDSKTRKSNMAVPQFIQPKKARKSKGKGSEKQQRQKKTAFASALTDWEQHWKATVKDVQAVCQGVNDKPAKLQTNPPKNLTFYSLKVPEGLPQHIRQSVHDLEFLLHEIYPMRETIIKQRDNVRDNLMVWLACDSEAWAYGKKHAHEYPDMELYEQTRSWLLASYILWKREEDKIHRYVRDNNLEGAFSKELSAALGVGAYGRHITKDVWETTFTDLKIEANSLREMLEECDEARKKYRMGTELDAATKHGEWWRALMSKS
ncbi:MAG: hypothetical protein M1830_009494 [Pleopsidium flavum]|nr:MAG: hypothetical protein M1830_009494 [Pleopsidium flavum]